MRCEKRIENCLLFLSVNIRHLRQIVDYAVYYIIHVDSSELEVILTGVYSLPATTGVTVQAIRDKASPIQGWPCTSQWLFADRL